MRQPGLSLIGRRAYRRGVPMATLGAVRVGATSLAGEGRREGSTDRPSPIRPLPKVKIVAFHRGPQWWVQIMRRLRPYKWVSLIEASFLPPIEIVRKGYLGGIKLNLGGDTVTYSQGDGRTCPRCRRVRATAPGPCSCGAIG